MASIDESGLAGKTRDEPISERLRRVLLAAADDADVDTVSVASGGQPSSGGHRVGSHRHDGGNAADLDLIKNGRTLKFTDPSDLEIFKRFVSSAAAHGANGIGAAEGYMGPTRIHVGFGDGPADTRNLVWGANGASANAPDWLRQAAQAGWAHPLDSDSEISVEPEAEHRIDGEPIIDDSEVERFRPLLDFIAVHEGTANRSMDGYNTSLGYGKYLPGGLEQNLVTQTLDKIYELGLWMRKQPGNPNSSALGRYQIVGQTLRGLQKKRGMSGSALYSAQLQDRFAVDLINGCGRNAQRLGATWASLKSVSSDNIYAAYDKDGRTMKPKPILPPLVDIPSDQTATVLQVQRSLNGFGLVPQLVEDGILGQQTMASISSFQRQNGLRQTGLPDAVTIAAIAARSGHPAAPLPMPVQPTLPMPDALSQIAQRIQALEQMIRSIAATTTPGETTNLNDPVNILDRILTVAQKMNLQRGTGATIPAGSGAPSADQLKQVMDMITAMVGQAGPQLGQVNGALGETIGNLLNGKKTAIGIGGSLITTLLAAVTSSPNAGGLAGLLGTIANSVPGLSQFTLPIFLAMTAWGALGKFEKWSQGTAPPPP
jgi:peptidoglycan hydrolase-like protein with peptidoglycan-binding domain